MTRTSLLLVLLSGCSLLEAATADKPNSDQQNAIGDAFVQIGTLASIAADPAQTTNDDLVTAMTFDHFARLINPSSASAPAPIALKPATPPPGCVVVNGDNRTLDCAVTLDDGRNCVVAGSLRREPRGEAFAYIGRVTLGGEGCPTGTADVDVTVEGMPEDPNLVNGSLTFSYDDRGMDIYTGSCVLQQLGITEKCPNVPSQGRLIVDMDEGSFKNGKPVNGRIELSFNESPGCGVILIE
ncbi:MAG: hypothetical protein L0206_24345 [Actinobacteria bacterium]|nr:hypothetical protein [Actinomycetota bacterium]